MNRAVVIGSGIAGLTAGVLLAAAGWEAVLVEKNRRPGGLMRGYRRGGVDFPVGVHYLPALGPGESLRGLLDLATGGEDLGLAPLGEEGVIDRYIFTDFTFDLPPGLPAFKAALLDRFPGESAAIEVIFDRLTRAADDILYLGRLIGGAASMSLDDLTPTTEFLENLGCSRDLIRVMSASTHLVGVPAGQCPIWLHFFTLAGYISSCWRLTRPGEELAEAAARRFQDLGGRLILGRSAAEVTVESGRAAGVRLADGERLPAEAVVAALHPKALLGLLPDGAIKPALHKRVSALEETPGVFCLQAAFPEDAAPAKSENRYLIDDQAPRPQTVFLQARPCLKPGTTRLTAIMGSPYENWAAWADSVTGKRPPGYYARKAELAADLLEIAGRQYGPLPEPEVWDAFSPLTLRDWVNAPQGGVYGVKRSVGQFTATASLAKRAAEGLYLAGQSILAPGVLGAGLSAIAAVGRIVGADRLRGLLGLENQA
jgi:phytoene dehydrogenase-like protein